MNTLILNAALFSNFYYTKHLEFQSAVKLWSCILSAINFCGFQREKSVCYNFNLEFVKHTVSNWMVLV